jgi:hypothetical protein
MAAHPARSTGARVDFAERGGAAALAKWRTYVFDYTRFSPSHAHARWTWFARVHHVSSQGRGHTARQAEAAAPTAKLA